MEGRWEEDGREGGRKEWLEGRKEGQKIYKINKIHIKGQKIKIKDIK